jgi:uncharacterized protein YbaP (TraB family)
MKNRNLLCLVAFWFVISASSAHADSPVRKIAKGNTQLFIGGTIHFLAKADYPLPLAFEKAYNQSAKIVFETDLQQMQTPEFQKKLLSKVAYPDGRSLKTVLTETTFKKLESHLSGRGIPMANMVNFKPGMVLMALTAIELQRLGLMGTGVDEFFNLRAINDRKKLGQLETADEQLALIATMGEGQEDELIAYTLCEIEKMPQLMQSIKDAWRNGDNDKLNEIVLTPLKKDFPEVYDELVVKRNRAWIPKIEAMLKTKEVELVLVGAMHLVGNEGVLARLASRGYDIQTFQ